MEAPVRVVHVYLLTNMVNGKQYVGITAATLSRRWAQHVYRAKRGDNEAPLLRAIKKYGADNFSIEMIACADTREGACKLERALIVEYKTRVPDGYNVTDGGDGGDTFSGKRHSAETIERMKRARAMLPYSLRATFLGRKHSEESINRMRLAQRGHQSSPERNAKISASLRRRSASINRTEDIHEHNAH